MTRARTSLAALLAACALIGVAVAAWQAHAAVRRAERQVLLAEAATTARLLREADGPRHVRHLLGDRWTTTGEVDPALGDAVIDPVAAVPTARAALLDADGWDTVGQVAVTGDAIRRARWPPTFWGAIAIAAAGWLAVAAWVVEHARRRGTASLARPALTWLIVAALLAAAPVVVAERWASASLRDLTDRRLALAAGVLGTRGDVVALTSRPSAVVDLTGVPAVPVATGASTDVVAGFLPAVAGALAAAPLDAARRITADHVAYAVREVAGLRLVLLPFEHTEGRATSMLASAAAGVAAGLPLLVLAGALDDRRRLRGELRAWSFLAPGLLHLLVFTLGPLAFAAWLSLHRYSLVDPARPFVGLANYAALATDDGFWNALRNTAVFTLHVPVSMAVALGLALLVRRPGRAATLARAAFFLPSITSLVAVAMVWQWILHDEYGLANAALGALGLPAVRWLSSPSVALVSVMIVATWTSLGFQTVLLQAGLTAIPRELYDAARIDGAGAWRRFLHVTLPGLRPTLFFVLVTSVIGSFQVFGTVYVMTEGGPLHATDVAVFHIYEEAWELQRVGSAAAMSWVLFAAIFVVTWLHFRALERRSA